MNKINISTKKLVDCYFVTLSIYCTPNWLRLCTLLM